MAISEMKNESLFQQRIPDDEARRIVAYALSRGWLIPAPAGLEAQTRPPKHKKAERPTLNCEEFRTDRAPASV